MGIVVRQSFLNLISIGVAFLIGAVNTLYLYPTFLGSKLQGLIIALLAISNLVQPFISFGTQHAVIRYYSKYTVEHNLCFNISELLSESFSDEVFLFFQHPDSLYDLN